MSDPERPATSADRLAREALDAVVTEDIAAMSPEEYAAAKERLKAEIRRRLYERSAAMSERAPSKCSMTFDAPRHKGPCDHFHCVSSDEHQRTINALKSAEKARDEAIARVVAISDELHKERESTGELRVNVVRSTAEAADLRQEVTRLRDLLSPPPPSKRVSGRDVTFTFDWPLTLEDLRRAKAAMVGPFAPSSREGNDAQGRPLTADALRRPASSRLTPPADVKPRPDLLPAEALLEAGACLADRVDRDVAELPWFDRAPLAQTIPKYRASLYRHVLSYLADKKTDPKSGRPHLAHVIVNAAILYRLENRAAIARQGKES